MSMMMERHTLHTLLRISPSAINSHPRRRHPCCNNAGDVHTPLVDAVIQRGNRSHEAPFHVPGHKRGSSVPPSLSPILGSTMQYDLTELDGLDYLSSPEGPILKAQQLAATAWGAGQTWFLVNGTTVGIHAAVIATCSCTHTSTATENALILARNAHQSGFNAAVLAGCAVEYAAPVTAHGLAHHVTPEALEAAFQRAKTRNLTPKAALVVSPTYFGIVSDVAALAAVCRRHGAILIVDEAHGAHLKFLADGLCSGDLNVPDGIENQVCRAAALQCGADIVVQSTHKQLGALTQGAMLHLSSNALSSPALNTTDSSTNTSNQSIQVKVDPARISRALSILQTSSPSYLIMASLDAARSQMQGPAALVEAHAAATVIHSWFNELSSTTTSSINSIDSTTTSHVPTPKLRLLTPHAILDAEESSSLSDYALKKKTMMESSAEECSLDPWRCTVLLENIKCTGWEASAALEEECGVVAELATHSAIVFAVGIGSTVQHATALIAGFEWLLARENNNIINANAPSSSVSNTKNYGIRNVVKQQQQQHQQQQLPEIVLTPRQALDAPVEVVPWEAAAGRISAELLCPYPPGVPVIYPGERIEAAMLETLRAVVAVDGGKVVGAADGELDTVRVIVDE